MGEAAERQIIWRKQAIELPAKQKDQAIADKADAQKDSF